MLPGVLSLQTTAIAAAAALVFGLAGGGYAAHSWYAPRLELAQEQMRTLGERVAEQNRSIENLRTEAEQRALEAKAAQDAALVLANKHTALAQQILARQKPAGVSECAAVEALFRERMGR